MDPFTAIVERDYPALRGYCAHLLTIPDDAEDVSQETFCAAWRHRAAMPADREGQQRWLHRIARNRCFDRNRREVVACRALPRCPCAPSADTEAEALRSIDIKETDAALGRLLLADRCLLMLDTELSGKEMGARLGVTQNAAKQRVYRARAHLRAAMTG